MAASAPQLNRLEAGRSAQLAQGRRTASAASVSRGNPLPSRFADAANDDVESANDDVETADNPVFGEEGFVDSANAHAKATGGGMEAGGEEEGPSAAEEASRSANLIREQAVSARTQQTAQEESETPEGETKAGLEDAVASVFKKGVDKIVFTTAGPTFGLTVLLWANIQFFVGDVIMGGKGKMIPALTWESLVEMVNSKAAKASKAGTKMLPKIALQILIIVIDLVFCTLLAIALIEIFIVFYALARFATDPAGAAIEFADTFAPFFSSFF